MRILVALLVTGAVAAVASFSFFLVFLPGDLGSTGIFIIGEAILALSALLGLWVAGRLLERRRFSELGFSTDSAGRDLALGALLGIALLTAVAGVFAAFGWYRIEGVAPGSPATALVQALLLFGLVAVFEEALWRGIVFRITEQGAGSAVALVVSSGLFGAAHLGNPNAGIMGAVGIALGAGVVLSASFMITRNLWMPIGLHWTWNLTEGTFYGMAVSGVDLPTITEATVSGPELLTGGAFGPEAGLVVIVIGLGAGIWLLTKAAKKARWVPFKKRASPEL